MHHQIKIRLPRLISDGMILQRNARVKIWGWAPAEEAVKVRFLDQSCSCVANQFGEWQVFFRTEDAGGPYEMEIEAGNGAGHVTLRNILLGDVWLCSGQI